MDKILSPAQFKFCEGLALGLSGIKAYAAAYPNAAEGTAKTQSCRLRKKPAILAEVVRLRGVASAVAGTTVMTLVERRQRLARIVRANIVLLDAQTDGDLPSEVKITERKDGTQTRIIRMDKLAALKLDHELAGPETEPTDQDHFRAMIRRVMERGDAQVARLEAEYGRDPWPAPMVGCEITTGGNFSRMEE